MAIWHLGISAFYHDSAAALVCGSTTVAAAQEERFTRKRHDPGFPANAVAYCLKSHGLRISDLAAIVYYENSAEKFARVVSSFAHAGLGGLSAFVEHAPAWWSWKRRAHVRVRNELCRLYPDENVPCVLTTRHHRAHAASAFYPSGFERAAVLCIDSVGEKHTTSIWHGRGKSLKLVNSICYPHSLGLLYSTITSFCGFKVDSGEYKLMGLAPYGEPIYVNTIRDNLVELRSDGSFALNLPFFNFLEGRRMFDSRLENLFGLPARTSESELSQDYCDIAASIQVIAEDAVLGLAKAAQRMTGERDLCLAGGVSLNCVANGKILAARLFDRLWVQPAGGDAGCAIGAALDAAFAMPMIERGVAPDSRDGMQGALLGPAYSDNEIAAFLISVGAPSTPMAEAPLLEAVADHLARGTIVGWFQGRMEFGPRALGSRSILGDPRSPELQRTMNIKIKNRESFRPFAPAVLEHHAHKYFALDRAAPYMSFVVPVADDIQVKPAPDRRLGSIDQVRSALPAITHVDMSARVQTVDEDRFGIFARLIETFHRKTGCPVLVNTSFNVRGEPIVCTPAEAYRCFMRTDIDVLVLGSHLLVKADQPTPAEYGDWRKEFTLD